MMQNRDFSNTEPSEFDEVKDLIVSMRWTSDMECCFLSCLCLEDQKVKFTLNLLRLGVKDWLQLVTSAYSPAKKAAVT